MQRLKISQVLCFITTLTSILGLSTAVAQEVKEKEERATVTMRVLCTQTVEGATDLKLMRDADVLHDLTLVPSMVSDPLGVGRGELFLTRRKPADADKPEALLKVTIPDAGKRFALVLLPAQGDDPKVPYRHLLIRTDGLKFDVSDLYLFNFTGVAVGGSLGESKFVIESGKSQVVTPKPGVDGRMYQAQFYFQNEGQARMFNDTRWPMSLTARVYVFFVADPERQSITYVSFREYAPFN